jgi:nucleoside-diphosphate-sugar epimerase
VVSQFKELGHKVTNLDRTRGEQGQWTFNIDIADAGQVYDALGYIKPDAVIHLAADPTPGARPRHAQFANNVLSTHAILQASADLGVKKVIYASSEMAAGWTQGANPVVKLPIAEEDATLPVNSYALGKRIGETICESTSLAHPEMSVVALRINYLVFEKDYEWIPKIEFPSGQYNLWGYLDGRDAAKAIVLATQRDLPGYRVYNVAAPDTFIDIPTAELMNRLGLEVSIREDWPEYGSPADCSKIERELGWKAEFLWREQSRA